VLILAAMAIVVIRDNQAATAAQRTIATSNQLTAQRVALGARMAAKTSSRRAATGGVRWAPAAAGAGKAARQPPRAGLPPGRARAKLPPLTVSLRRLWPSPSGQPRVIPPFYVPSVARACSCTQFTPSGVARRRRTLEAAGRVATDPPQTAPCTSLHRRTRVPFRRPGTQRGHPCAPL
jgi:hypothetical protein